MNYVLNKKGEPVLEQNLAKFAGWFAKNERAVAKERIGDVLISTVFLGIDHAFGKGPPVLWETMVFGGKLDMKQYRCSGSKKEAEAMHLRTVEKVKRSIRTK